jgi:hypothetical protein
VEHFNFLVTGLNAPLPDEPFANFGLNLGLGLTVLIVTHSAGVISPSGDLCCLFFSRPLNELTRSMVSILSFPDEWVV